MHLLRQPADLACQQVVELVTQYLDGALTRPERRRFEAAIAGLGNHGLRSVPSQANFVLILFEAALSAEAAYQGLMEHGYITRWLPGQGLPHGLRITIGTAEQMDAIAAGLREMAESAK